MITKIRKRDGREVPFNVEKIANAIFKAAQSVGGNNYEESLELAYQVCTYLEEQYKNEVPTVEQVQDVVERVLIERGFVRSAKSYILYRAERSRVRARFLVMVKIQAIGLPIGIYRWAAQRILR